ncbi:MAG: helix-turn-helix domain-containing protein [Prevotella sp.]|nr:helix-turn-helix domain-containing protein [Prevotella sp.]
MLKDKIQGFLTAQRRTVKDLSKHIGMSDTAIRNIYSRDSCELSTLRKIAGFFGVAVTDLLEETDVRIEIRDVKSSFNPGQNDTETIQKLMDIIEKQRNRIDELTDKLLEKK